MLVSLCEPGQLEKLGPVLESHSIVPWVLCALRRGGVVPHVQAGRVPIPSSSGSFCQPDASQGVCPGETRRLLQHRAVDARLPCALEPVPCV